MVKKKRRKYKQCILEQNGFKQVLWIETRGAKKGADVELIDKGFWQVIRVFDHILDEDELKIQETKARVGFASTKGEKV